MLFLSREEINRSDLLFVVFMVLASLGLFFLPTGFETDLYKNSVRVKALVLETRDDRVRQFGVVKQGNQDVRVRILSGKFRDREFEANNTVLGKMELDKIFKSGDTALAVLDLDPGTGEVVHATVLDHYRINAELFLFVFFAGVLFLFAGWTGFKALLSFVFSGLVIWKLLVPGILRGIDPVLVSLSVVTILTLAIVFLVGGFTPKGLIAFLGALAGISLTCLLSVVFDGSFRNNGAVKPFSETLLHSGFPHLDLGRLFLAGTFLASAGAMMDVSMDIAAALTELKDLHPELPARSLVLSGFRIGRAVIGTMTTTLLLAYSGSYTSLLMIFVAQGIPMTNLFNLSYVSAEVFHTLVGSFGLILAAPATAVVGGFLLTIKKQT